MGEIKSVAGTMCSLLALRFISTDDATFSVSLNNLKDLKEYFILLMTGDNTLTFKSVKWIYQDKSLRSLLLLPRDTTRTNTYADSFDCKICLKTKHADSMRQHVAIHFVCDPLPSDEHICGYCGTLCGNGVSLVVSSGYGKSATLGPASGCPYFRPFSLKAAAKSSKSTPTTNRPVPCTLCNKTLWSYNIPIHYKQLHATEVLPEEFDLSHAEKYAVMAKHL
jgi:hypothetical protein